MSIINHQVRGGCARDATPFKRDSSAPAPYVLEPLDTVLLLRLTQLQAYILNQRLCFLSQNNVETVFISCFDSPYDKVTSHDA